MANRSSRNKKNRRNKRTQTQRPRQPRPAAARAKAPIQEIANAHTEAVGIAVEQGLDRSLVGDDPKPEGADNAALWEMVREARDLYHQAQRQYESRNDELDTKAAKLDEQECSTTARGADLDRRERELMEERTGIEKRDSETAERERALQDRESDVRRREINAECGFDEERRQILAQLDEARESFRSEFAERYRTGESRLKEREDSLDEREDRLAEEQRQLAGAKRRVEFEAADLEELRTHLDDRAEQLAAAKREEYEHSLQSLKDQLERAREDRDRQSTVLNEREEADRKFGQRTPDEVLKDLNALREDNDRLEAELAKRPDVDAAARLAGLERERESWQADRAELTRKVSEYQRRLAQNDTDSNERENQRNVIDSLTSGRALLTKANQDLRSEVDNLLGRSEARTPFPACTAMDEDRTLQSEQRLETDLDLRAFVEDLQHRIAHTQPDHLYYAIVDLRSFVGGLAMGRLILLQGISGTGKTSLPVAFADAIGTQAAEIKVQAGWRDPQDLIGHYNTFEKKFHETEFLKALYRARAPRWKDTVQVVLLDEMNLSHPEQYFSDLLSTLELPEDDQRLDLMTHSVVAAPTLLDDGGKLRIPPNVWFVGTANHDETTVDFADKTYDRSHVMEFPTRPERFVVQEVQPRLPISFNGLQEAFKKAISRHSDSAKEAINYLDSQVRDSLAGGFDVGWGPRFERQMQRYVPVVVASGGTVGEATDHMLAMRLLRKLRNRHDIRPELVADLKQRIRESWSDLDRKSDPTKSLKQLDSELKRLGQDPENEG